MVCSATGAEAQIIPRVGFGQHVATLFDDHDQVRQSGDEVNNGDQHLKPCWGSTLCSMGIPCLDRGTEQGFDGLGNTTGICARTCSARLQSADRHFFNEGHDIGRCIAEVTALRRGRQNLRGISDSGTPEASVCRT